MIVNKQAFSPALVTHGAPPVALDAALTWRWIGRDVQNPDEEIIMPTAISADSGSKRKIEVRVVHWSQPVNWLRSGWYDLRDHWRVRLAHGVFIALFWLLLLGLSGTHPYSIAALISGFMLIGPAMTSGLCELSRRGASGEALTFDGSLEGFSRNREAMMRFSAVLAGLTIAWFLGSVVVLQTVFHQPEPTTGEILYGGFLGSSTPEQLLDYLSSGALLALFVFSVSVVAVPLMLDRHASAADAMRTSVRAVWHNLPAMIVWSSLLVVLAAIGIGTLLIGLVAVVPLMGHATWHAYQDLVA